jgi:mono/diheme cytochrome c family protein
MARCAFAFAALVVIVTTGAVLASQSAQVTQGRELYVEYCQLCHGPDGKRGEGFQTPIWGPGSLIASKFGDALKLFEYMQVMPFNDPSLLDPTQKLAVVAYMLVNHGVMEPAATLDYGAASGFKLAK